MLTCLARCQDVAYLMRLQSELDNKNLEVVTSECGHNLMSVTDKVSDHHLIDE
jgi:hypothetical protein